MFTSWKQRVLRYRKEKHRFLLAQKRGVPVYEHYFFHKGEKWLYIGVSLFITIFLAMFFYRSIWAVLPLSPIGVKCYLMFEKSKGEKRKRKLETEFKDCILAVSANLRAGYGVENAFVEAIPDMQALYGENSLMCQELYFIKKGLGNNRPLEKLLLELGTRSKSDNLEEFAEVFSIAVQNGGNLPEIIQDAADMIGEKIVLAQEIQVLISGRVFEQRIMSVIPFFLVFYVETGNKGFFDVLYHNLTGVSVMTVCLVIYLAAQLLSQKICKIAV